MKNKLLKLMLFSSLIAMVSCDPFNTEIEKNSPEETVVKYTAGNIKTPVDKDTLKVVSWNIKFGGGRIDFFFDCYGDKVLMSKDSVIYNMNGVVAEINHLDPDIIFLQEADINSKRSAYVDQVQWILDNTNLNYGVYASQWQADYVPSDGIGKVNSGNAILSKYPLDDAKRIALSLIGDQSAVVQYFYLRRNLLEASVTIKDKKIYLLGTHASAYATDDTKKKQLQEIKNETVNLVKNKSIFILGGDFNTIPPNSKKYENFDDDKCAEGSDFASLGFKDELNDMQPFYDDYQAAISQEEYDAENSAFFSFTSDKNGFWNRKLDYLFTNGNFVKFSGLVHQDKAHGGAETMPLSDHAPLSVLYVLP